MSAKSESWMPELFIPIRRGSAHGWVDSWVASIMRTNAGANEGARRMNREMNYRYRSDGVGYMCCKASKGNVHKKVIKVVDWGYNKSVMLDQEVMVRGTLYIPRGEWVLGPRNRTPGQKLGKIMICMV